MKYMHDFLLALVNAVCSLFPMKKEIILESHPDLSCNTFELYKMFLNEGVNEKFKITWLVNNPHSFDNIFREHNVYFTSIKPHSFFAKIALYIRCNRARIIITGNRHVQKYRVSKKQLNINIEHGSPIKDCTEEYKKFFCDYIIIQSPFFIDNTIKQYRLPKASIVPLGLPRNDQLFRNYNNISKLFPNIYEYKKVICWMPTFREHFDGKRVDSSFRFPLGLPILYDLKAVSSLNSFLSFLDVIVIIKPHPAQDLSKICELSLSNIKLLYNSDLEKEHIQINELLSQTDALITDYSGVYFDYLLLDKPIGITLDDFEQYRSSKGFVYDDFKSIVVGDYIYDLNGLRCFIKDVCDNNDTLLEKRKIIKALTNVEPYGESTKRLFYFINSLIPLK